MRLSLGDLLLLRPEEEHLDDVLRHVMRPRDVDRCLVVVRRLGRQELALLDGRDGVEQALDLARHGVVLQREVQARFVDSDAHYGGETPSRGHGTQRFKAFLEASGAEVVMGYPVQSSSTESYSSSDTSGESYHHRWG